MPAAGPTAALPAMAVKSRGWRTEAVPPEISAIKANPMPSIAATGVRAVPSVLERFRADIDSALRRAFERETIPARPLLRYSMGWSDVNGNPTNASPGKALRPTLCLLACEATGGSVAKALPAALALELIHNFSLIHDEIQDRDETRHHRATLWTLWGDQKALVAGNSLRVIADRSLWRLVEGGVPFEDSLKVAGVLTEAYLDMIEGQYLDLAFEGPS